MDATMRLLPWPILIRVSHFLVGTCQASVIWHQLSMVRNSSLGS